MHTPGKWTVSVTPVSCGLERTSYAHQVHIPGRMPFAVAHHDHQNYDHIVQTDLPDRYVRRQGVGKRAPDLTPHPDALLISAAPDLLAALIETLAVATRNEEGDFADRARAAIGAATRVSA